MIFYSIRYEYRQRQTEDQVGLLNSADFLLFPLLSDGKKRHSGVAPVFFGANRVPKRTTPKTIDPIQNGKSKHASKKLA